MDFSSSPQAILTAWNNILAGKAVAKDWQILNDALGHFLPDIKSASINPLLDFQPQINRVLDQLLESKTFQRMVDFLMANLPVVLPLDGQYYANWDTNPQLGVRIHASRSDLSLARLPKIWTPSELMLELLINSEEGVRLCVSGACLDLETEMLMKDLGANSVLFLPVRFENVSRGCFLLTRNQDSPVFTDLELQAARKLVSFSISWVWLHTLLDRLDKRVQELETVFDASLDLTGSLNQEEVLNAILRNALSLLRKANDAHIFLYDGQELTFGAAMFKDGSIGTVWAMPRKDGLTYNVARSGEKVYVNNIASHPWFKNTSWSGSIVGIPLAFKQNVIGVMTMASLEPDGFSDSDLRVMDLLADQAAIAIQNARLHDLISRQAQTDALTGLPNRRAFDQELEKHIGRSSNSKRSVALMLLDLNHFKKVNDNFGHPVGDQVLKTLASCLNRTIRKSDFLARIGGDEFAVVLPDTSLDEASLVGDKIVEAIKNCKLILPDGNFNEVGISYGIAVFPDDHEDLARLIEIADGKLYTFKRTQTGQ